MPKVSVIIPVYNTERFLRQCLDSVLAQTEPDFEIICVDDGSTDGSAQILEEYRKADLRVRVLRQKHLYAGVARNNGMDEARGEYLYFLDSDDYVDNNLIEETYQAAEDMQADIVGFDFKSYDMKRCFLRLTPQQDILGAVACKMPFSYRTNSKYIFQFARVAVWRKLYRREFIVENKISFQPLKRANDLYFIHIASVKADRIAYIDKKMMTYRNNNDNSLQGATSTDPMTLGDIFKSIYEELVVMGIYDLVEQSFINECVQISIYSLDKLKSKDLFINHCNMLKQDVFFRYGIEQKPKDYFYVGRHYDIIRQLLGSEMYMLEREKSRQEAQPSKIWPFPFHKIPRSGRVVLYGAGGVGQDFYRQAVDSGYCNIVLWADREYVQYRQSGLPVSAPGDIVNTEYDNLIICIVDTETAWNVHEFLIELGVPVEKIIWRDFPGMSGI